MTTNTDFEYYTILPFFKENTVLLMNDFSKDPEGIDFLYMAEPAPKNHTAYLQFHERNLTPDLDVDYFDLDSAGVFSTRIKEVLDKIMPIKFFEFVPAVIKDDRKNEIKDFWIGNIYQEIYCFDENQSEYSGVTNTGRWEGIDKIVIDKKKMNQIPLAERLVIVPYEGSQFHLYHKSVMDVIQAANPKGMRIINIEEWHAQSIYGL